MGGTVIRTGRAKLLEHEKRYECAKCHQVATVQADLYTNALPKPTACLTQIQPDKICGSKRFIDLSTGPAAAAASSPAIRARDYQEIRIQEQVNKLAIGTIPSSMTVILQDDLVDTCKAGDDVLLSGTVIRRWKPPFAGQKCDIELALLANHVVIKNEQHDDFNVTEAMKADFRRFWERYRDRPMTGRNKLIEAFCPQVYGLYIIKLAVMLTMTGGVQHVAKAGVKTRGEPHLLLVGDPGTGKSQFFLLFLLKLWVREPKSAEKSKQKKKVVPWTKTLFRKSRISFLVCCELASDAVHTRQTKPDRDATLQPELPFFGRLSKTISRNHSPKRRSRLCLRYRS
jgi:DNA helicase MCM9